jgi:hypothetical protein
LFRFVPWLRHKPRTLARPTPRTFKLEHLEERVVPDSGGAYGVLAGNNLVLNPFHAATGSATQIIPNVKIQPIFVVDPGTGASTAYQAQLTAALQNIVSSGMLPSLLDQYDIPGVTIGNGSVAAPDVVSAAPTEIIGNGATPNTYDDGYYYSEFGELSPLQQIIQGEITAGNTAPSDGLNNLYVVFTPPGDAVDSGDGTSIDAFLGYHSSFTDQGTGKSDTYAVIPDQSLTGPNANLSYDGVSPLQGETVVLSHEISEAVSDPNGSPSDGAPTGWINASASSYGFLNEVGDQAAGNFYTDNGFLTQYLWSNAYSGITHAAGTGPEDLAITQVTPPAVTGVRNSPVATFTDNDTSLTANDFYVEVYDTVTDPTGAPSAAWTNVSVTGSDGHFVIDATPPAGAVKAGAYGDVFGQDGFTVIVSTSPIDTTDPSGDAPLSVRVTPYDVAAAAPLNYVAEGGTGTNTFVLKQVGSNFQLSDNGQVVFTQPVGQTTNINIKADPAEGGNPAASVNDTLTVDYSGGVFSSAHPVTFDGGPASVPPAAVGNPYTQTLPVIAGPTPYSAASISGFSGGVTGLTAANISINRTAGTITINARPTGSGTVSFTVNVTDSKGNSLSRRYTLQVVSVPLTLTPAALPAGDALTPYDQTIAVSGGKSPYTSILVSGFSDSGTGLTAGEITANAAAGTVVIDGTPTGAGTATFTVTVKDSGGSTLSETYTVTVNPALSVFPTTLPQAVVGTAYTQTIDVDGGTAPYTTFAVNNLSTGTTGLSSASVIANPATGTVVVSGTPTGAGTVTFTLNVTDAAGGSLTQNYTITVNPALALSGALPPADTSYAYNQIITATGGVGPYTHLTVGNFQGGTTGLTAAEITPSPALGEVTVSGTPSATGTATFNVTVTDSTGASVTQGYTITVDPPLAVGPATLQPVTAGASTNQTITISGGGLPYSQITITAFSAGGTGLTAANIIPSSTTVQVSGTPSAAGTASFTVNFTDAAGVSLSQQYTLTVSPGLVVSPSPLPQATAGTTYNQTLTVTGGTGGYSSLTVTNFSAGTTGLTSSAFTTNAAAGTVVVTGTPAAAGTATFTVSVKDSTGAVLQQTETLTVNPALSITPPQLPQGVASMAYKQTLTVSGGTPAYAALTVTNFSAGTTGLILGDFTTSPAAGTVAISGTPTAAGTATFTVNVTDAAGATLTKNYSITVTATSLALNPATPPQGTAGASYNQTIMVTGGTKPYQIIEVSNFQGDPTGLSLANVTPNASAGTVTISGTPTVAGTDSFTVTVNDSAGGTLQQTVTVTINPALSITGSLPSGTVGVAYNQTLTISGGTLPYGTPTVTGFNSGGTGLTTAGISTTATTVVVRGTPSFAGIASFTVNVTDAAGATLSQQYKITVTPANLVVSPATPPQGTAGAAYNQTLLITGGVTPFQSLTVTGFSGGGTGLTSAAVTPSAKSGAVFLTGTPTAAGTVSFTINAKDGSGAVLQQAETIVINPPLSLPAPPAATAGTAYDQTLALAGGTSPYTALTVTGLTAGTTGLSLSDFTTSVAQGAVIVAGTPTGVGTASFSVTAADSAGATLSGTYTITVNPPLSISANNLPPANTGVPYSQTITVVGGTAPYTLGVTNFTPGNTGFYQAEITTPAAGNTFVLSGTPTGAGTASFTVNVTDAAGATLTQNYTVSVITTPPAGISTNGGELDVVATQPGNLIRVYSSGTSPTGSTGLYVTGTLNGQFVSRTFSQAFTTVHLFGVGGDTLSEGYALTVNTLVTETGGSNYIQTAGGNDVITLAGGNNQVYGGAGNKAVTLGDSAGTKNVVQLGGGNNTVFLGNGNDTVVLGNGNNVLQEGSGTDSVQVGNGDNLIVAGLGKHTVQAGNGSNILFDGSVTLTQANDSLEQVLQTWIQGGASAAAGIRSRVEVSYNASQQNTLDAGSGLDWFWEIYSLDSVNKKTTDLLN